MNVVDVIFILIIVFMAFTGAKRGFLVSFLSAVRFIIGVPLSFGISDRYYQTVYDSYVRQSIYDYVLKNINKQSDVKSYLSELSESIEQLPIFFTDKPDTSLLSTFSTEKLAAYVTDNLIEPIAVITVKVVMFVGVFIAFYIISGILINLIKGLRKRKDTPLHKTGGFLGALFGILKSAVFIYTLCTIAGFLTKSGINGTLVDALRGSMIIEFVNRFNLLV